MKRHSVLYTILAVAVALCGLTACTDNLLTGDTQRDPQNELAVDIEATCSALTRAGGSKGNDNDGKFSKGDTIQVSAVFTLADADGNETSTTDIRYDRYVFDGTKWTSVNNDEKATDEPMTWPWNATKGTFTAYYQPAIAGKLQQGDENAKQVKLDDLTDTTDPLRAVTENVEYGHAVKMNFTHICTRLILLNINDPSQNTEYLFSTFNSSSDHTEKTLKNKFKLYRDAEGNLQHTFVADPEDNTTLTRPAEEITIQFGDSEEQTYKCIEVYLATDETTGTADCTNFNIKRSNGAAFLQATNIEGLNKMHANQSYIVDLSRELGVVNIEEDGGWKPIEDDDIKELAFDIQTFLNNIRDGKDYIVTDAETQKQTQILKASNGGSTVTLMCNVNFGNANNYIPVNLRNITFNGNHCYIENFGQTIFGDMESSTVKNLGLHNANITFNAGTEREVNNNGEEITGSEGIASGKGALARENTGTIDNIRLENITLTVNGANSTLGKTYYAGALVGACSGGNSSATNISLGGDIIIKTTDESSNGTFMLGGIIGQISSNCAVSEITMRDINEKETTKVGKVNITNSMTGGKGTYLVGGIVGEASQSTLTKCVITGSIDASASYGTENCVGGAVGRMADNCTLEVVAVDITVKGGTVATSTESIHHAYTGGMVGLLANNCVINLCKSFSDITGAGTAKGEYEGTTPTYLNQLKGAIYATGGVIGGMQRPIYTVTNNDVFGTVSTGGYVGGVVGMCIKATQSSTLEGNTCVTTPEKGAELEVVSDALE